MPRPPRLDAPGAFHHVTARGNRLAAIYLDDTDRTRFVSFLADAVQRFEWRCHAFALMSNHFHLVLETPKATVAAGKQWLSGRYGQTFNRRHATTAMSSRPLLEQSHRARPAPARELPLRDPQPDPGRSLCGSVEWS